MLLATLALIVALLSAAFTGWYALETRRMRRDNKAFADEQLRQAKASSDAAERSATAAETSAKAAQESAKIAAEGMQISERAYLGVESFKLKTRPNAFQNFYAEVVLKNFGSSPALDAKIVHHYSIRSPISNDLIFPDTRPKGMSLAPGASFPLEYQATQPVAQADMNAINEDRQRLYFFGWARYKDIFAKEHITRWCYQYSPSSPSGLIPVPEYNTME